MTTFEPGASEVFTHGLTSRPRSTALRASRPAPIITLGFDVFVHDVMAAITTWPWSSSVSVPSASVSGTLRRDAVGDLRARPCRRPRPPRAGGRATESPLVAGGSEAGKLSSDCSSASVCGGSTRSSSASRNDALDSVSDTRSCGRFGPASDGTTSPRSSSSVSE